MARLKRGTVGGRTAGQIQQISATAVTDAVTDIAGDLSGSGKGTFVLGVETAGNVNVSGSVYAVNDVYTDQVRRNSSNSTTTKINLDANAQKFYVGHSSNEITKITSSGMATAGDVSGSGKGTFVAGIETAGSLKVTGSATIGSATMSGSLQAINDYSTTAFESQLSDGEAGTGTILKYEPGGSTTLVKGRLYFLHTDGTWDETAAGAASTGKQLLGIALGNSATSNGLLLRGFVKIPSTEVLNVPGSGASDGLPVYISTTAGHLDFTAPSATGDIVRIAGYCIDDDSSDILLWLCPDNTWVEIA